MKLRVTFDEFASGDLLAKKGDVIELEGEGAERALALGAVEKVSAKSEPKVEDTKDDEVVEQAAPRSRGRRAASS